MSTKAKLALVLMATSAWVIHAQKIESPTPAASDSRSTPLRSPDLPHGSSAVAIAWLSELRGEVQLAASGGRRFGQPSRNVPVAEGTIIQTGMGRAEVEFEDNSTIRLGPYSRVEFSRLRLLGSGATASNILVLKGTVYASLIPAYIVNSRWNDFQLTFGQQSMLLQKSSHVRLELEARQARLTLLDGMGRVDGPSGAVELARKKTFTFSLDGQSKPAVLKRMDTNPMDAWDRSAVKFHQNRAKTEKPNGTLFEPPLRAVTSPFR